MRRVNLDGPEAGGVGARRGGRESVLKHPANSANFGKETIWPARGGAVPLLGVYELPRASATAICCSVCVTPHPCPPPPQPVERRAFFRTPFGGREREARRRQFHQLAECLRRVGIGLIHPSALANGKRIPSLHQSAAGLRSQSNRDWYGATPSGPPPTFRAFRRSLRGGAAMAAAIWRAIPAGS